MNKKSIELAKQAGFVFWEDESWRPESQYIDWATDYDKELEKLIELIVNECASHVKHIKIWDTDLGEVIKQKYYDA
ncbi:MAG: hypothetical protein EB127_00745 [Alphaproteobacteria bacterium]|nr:hypothetical protein [Alphaproteobacteria bacterium]